LLLITTKNPRRKIAPKLGAASDVGFELEANLTGRNSGRPDRANQSGAINSVGEPKWTLLNATARGIGVNEELDVHLTVTRVGQHGHLTSDVQIRGRNATGDRRWIGIG
jgi:hypothetical protein